MNEFPWITVLTVLLSVIAALVGGAVVIWGDPGALTFAEYLKYMSGFVAGLGLVGIGRGVRSGLIKRN